MTRFNERSLISQAEYVKVLRPLLPSEAFTPAPSKLLFLLMSWGILILGWLIASKLDQWPPYLLWLYLPLAVLMGNSITFLMVFSHELMHGSVIRNARLVQVLGFWG